MYSHLVSPSQTSQERLQWLSIYEGFLEHSPFLAQELQYWFSSTQFSTGGVGIVVVVVVVAVKIMLIIRAVLSQV